MLTPRDYDLPFDEFRPYQLETALRIVAAFQRGVKLVLLQAPTGIGKTLISVLVAIMLEVNLLYTCHTKALQAQFMKDFGDLGAKELTGRRNYPCLKDQALFPRLTAELCTWKNPNCKACELSKRDCQPDSEGHCPCKSECPYEIQKRGTERAPIGVLNTPYHLLATNFASGFDDREFTVLDEIDQMENSLMSMIEVSVPETMMKKYDLPRPKFKTKRESWEKWAPQALEIVKLKLSKLQGLWGVDDLIAEHQLSRLKAKLEFFINEVDDTWVYDGESSFKPIWVSRYADKYLWSHAKRFLGMSATVSPWRQLCHDLGIQPSEVEFIDVPSVFDASRRPIYYQPAANMNHDTKEAEFPSLVAALDKILERHPNEKGLVHCVSYSNVSQILKLTRYSERMITHRELDRQSQLSHFMGSSKPLVLLSPSMERGIDLPYDLCRFVIIAKMPFPYLGDPQVSARLYRSKSSGQQWYNAATARRLVQSTGRAMRSADDFCISYILDSAFGEFYQKNSSMFPRWWREALIMPKGGDA
ncbi:ATP-dependent DNA helicase DinG [subsurface metagenome]